MSVLRFYYREGCHLCEDMLQELKWLQTDWQFELIEVDIDHYPDIRDRYHTRIPFLEDQQGRCLSEYFLDQMTLLRYLQGV